MVIITSQDSMTKIRFKNSSAADAQPSTIYPYPTARLRGGDWEGREREKEKRERERV